MKYRTFEVLVLLFAVVATAGTVVAVSTPDTVEVVAQLLLIGIVFAALRYGSRGGALASMLGLVIYVLMRSSLIASDGLTATVLQLIGIRAVLYGSVGIVGGEICSRIKYFFMQLEHADYIDQDTHLYSAAYIEKLLRTHMAQHSRYKSVFSLIMVSLDRECMMTMKRKEAHRLMRDVGGLLRHDVRVIDEVGRLDTATFAVLLPNTPKAGAEVASGRLTRTVMPTLRKHRLDDGEAKVTALSFPEDEQAIRELIRSPEEQA